MGSKLLLGSFPDIKIMEIFKNGHRCYSSCPVRIAEINNSPILPDYNGHAPTGHNSLIHSPETNPLKPKGSNHKLFQAQIMVFSIKCFSILDHLFLSLIKASFISGRAYNSS